MPAFTQAFAHDVRNPSDVHGVPRVVARITGLCILFIGWAGPRHLFLQQMHGGSCGGLNTRDHSASDLTGFQDPRMSWANVGQKHIVVALVSKVAVAGIASIWTSVQKRQARNEIQSRILV